MEGERVAISREADVGATVLTVPHASVPPMGVEKRREVVQEKAEKLQPKPTSPEQTSPCHSPGGNITSPAQSWGRREGTEPSNSQQQGLFPPAFAAVGGGATPGRDVRLGRGSFY
ncbi:hypothetical protein llap_7931 [Limosa lapponica baueri]|uniref:Uncharacterized protein n=1 Tax=Limosa lapponica baueri TaxID=1758121 RepID=A0A2I0U6T3_LIMLA|nr:hypothetical protein llap_7931 [Limosa lapponica baueri]